MSIFGTLVAIAVSPIAVVVDATKVIRGEKPFVTKNAVKMVREETAETVANIVDAII